MPKINKSFVEKGITRPGWYRDDELKGFCVRARGSSSSTLTKTYAVNARIRGTQKNITVTIGVHGVITAEQARIEAARVLAKLAQGEDPNIEAQRERNHRREEEARQEKIDEIQSRTLADLLEDYLRTHNLKPRTIEDYRRFTTRCLKDWLNVPVSSITRDMVQRRFLELSEKHPAQANLTMRILRALMRYAIAVYEDDRGRPLLAQNPVDRLSHARLWNKVKRRERVILPNQLKAWYEAVMKLQREDARDVLLVEVFTGLRHGEAISLMWRNIDFAHNTLLVEDTKNGTNHMLPLSTYLRSILDERWQISGRETFVFPSQGKSGHLTDIRDSIAAVITSSGVRFSEHDLRRTFETVAESLDLSYFTLKRLLNHKTGSDPTAGYIITTADRLRVASERIANTLAGYMGMPQPKPTTSNVIKMPRSTYRSAEF